MKTSKLTKMATAALVCFGAIASMAATGDIHEYSAEDFEKYDIGKVNPDTGKGVFEVGADNDGNTATNSILWDYSLDDASEIAVVTDFGDLGAAEDGNKVLKLDTQGAELRYLFASATEEHPQGTTSNWTALVDATIQMIGSETAPVVSNAQTAVYLDIGDESNHVLRAWVKDGWVALTNENVSVKDGDWINLRVEIDYTSAFTGDTPDVSFYVNDNRMRSALNNSDVTFKVQNSADAIAKKCVTEVAFRGTGYVDNFIVSEKENSPAFVYVYQEFVNKNGEYISPTVANNPLQFGAEGEILFNKGEITGYEIEKAWLYKVEGGETNLVGNGVDAFKTIETNSLAYKVIFIPTLEDGYVSGDTFIVRGFYKANEYDITINFRDYESRTIVTSVVDKAEYGSTFRTNVIEFSDGTVDVYYGEYNVDEPGDPAEYLGTGNPELVLANVTGDVVINLLSVWDFSTEEPAVITFGTDGAGTGAGLKFTAIALGATPSVTIESFGTTRSGEMNLWIVAKESLTGESAANIYFPATATPSSEVDQGIFNVDLVVDPSLFDGYDSLFFLGITVDDPNSAN